MKWKWSGRPSSKWWIVPPIVVGMAVLAALVATRKGPGRAAPSEASRTLRVIRVPVVDVVPRILGYGTARPGQVWRAVAEVQGRVLEAHEHLKPGAMIRQGETLLRIDPAEYDLAIAQFEADIAQIRAQLAELETKEANDRASLEIEEASLELAQRELERVESLLSRNAASPSQVDQQSREVLRQRQGVQNLRNALQLVPQQRRSLEAALEVKSAGLAQARLDRAKTEIRAPLDCRLGEVNIEPGQFLAAGQTLFEAQGTDVTELEAQLPLNQLRNLIRPELRTRALVAMDAKTVREVFDFGVSVRFRSGDFVAEWEGRVARLREQIDPRTRTIGLVLAVDKPYEQAIPGRRPPLMQGMYCEAELRGAVRADRVVVPRSALHEGHVYLVGGDGRLQRRRVEVEFTQSGFACLESGLDEGERLVVSDPTPAIEGLLVEPVTDEAVRSRLIAEATGEGGVR
jgi:RND family efflux transporter MFP subunit